MALHTPVNTIESKICVKFSLHIPLRYGMVKDAHFRGTSTEGITIGVSPVCSRQYKELSMRTGKSLTEMAAELERIQNNKRDLIAPVGKISMDDEGLLDLSGEKLGMNRWSDGQLASYTDVPKAYYDRLRLENTALLAQNVNHGLSRKDLDDKRLIRTLDGQVRAVLSNRYRVLDGYDLFSVVFPILLGQNPEGDQFQVVSSEITERRMYVRALLPRMEAEVKVGDPVQFGIQVSSSDVGAGSLRIEPLIYRLVCANGMITEHAMRKYHVGRAQAQGDDIFELMSDKTRMLNDAAFWASVRDVLLASMRPEIFEAQVNKLRDAADRHIKNYDLEEVVDVTCKTIGLAANKDTKQSIIAALATGNQNAGLTQWGLANSFTAVAATNETIGFDDVVELERAGGHIIDMPLSHWKKIAG